MFSAKEQPVASKNSKVIETGGKGEIRIEESLFKESVYINVRFWWDDKPTKQGITIKKNDFASQSLDNWMQAIKLAKEFV